MNSTGTLHTVAGADGLAARWTSALTASHPIAVKSCRTVVSAGEVHSAMGSSSKPTSETSSGTCMPTSANARIACRAIASQEQKTAVGKSSRDKSVHSLSRSHTADVALLGDRDLRAERIARFQRGDPLPQEIRYPRARRDPFLFLISLHPDKNIIKQRRLSTGIYTCINLLEEALESGDGERLSESPRTSDEELRTKGTISQRLQNRRLVDIDKPALANPLK